MKKHINSVRYAISGENTDGTQFSTDGRWWQESGRNIQELVKRLEKPMLREFDEETNRHREYAKKVKCVEVVEYRSTSVAAFGEFYTAPAQRGGSND